MRKVCGYALSALSLLTLTACSPAVRGFSGIRLNAGGPVAVLGLCDGFGTLRTMSLYRALPEGGVGDAILELERVSEHPSSPVLTVELGHPDDSWRITAGQPPSSLDPTQAYELRAWNAGGDNRVYNFPFQVGELPSEGAAAAILVKTYSNGGYTSQTMNEESFEAFTQDRCGRD
jgi:hypothetical protein